MLVIDRAAVRRPRPQTLGALPPSVRYAPASGARSSSASVHPRARPTFALKLIACAFVGATIALLLWPVERRPGEGGPLRSFEAVTPALASPEPLVREVKTVKFTAPRSQPTLAALSPVASFGSPSAMPMNKPFEIKSWRYQLQNIDPSQIARSGDDLAVVDLDGDGGALGPDQIERMRRKPDGSRRLVLAYLSIGEAESYRPYWERSWRKQPPAWLGKENSKWRGNFAVRFWDPEWQAIVFARVDRIVAAGFDGLYLDKVDEFETLGHRKEMVDFVARIAARGKSRRSDLMIVSQNGDALIPDAKFRHAIDAFAREDLFYGENSDGVRNDADSIRESVERLKLFAAEGKPVLVVEYPRNDEQARVARREIAEHNFIGLMARRALDR
jgi:cysteinyl-tRNA synthetase, unknown class